MIPALLGGKNSMLRIHPKALPSLALWGLRFLRIAGVKLGILPAKGYTITVPVDAELPKTIMLDIGLHIGIIPMLHDL